MSATATGYKRSRMDGPATVFDTLLSDIDSTTFDSKVVDGKTNIGTHHGTFHNDEVLACTMLKLLPEYKEAAIVRTRDEEVLKGCQIVVDVGGKYDPAALLYDHHQREFTETYSEAHDVTKLSSAGLVFKHHGKDVITAICKGKDLPGSVIDIFVQKIYEGLMTEVDAIDNGVEIAGDAPVKYRITSNLGARVSRLNPPWNADTSPAAEGEGFRKAMVGENIPVIFLSMTAPNR